MKKTFDILLSLLLVFYSINCCCQSPKTNIKIHGQLIDPITKDPIPGVIIKIDSSLFRANEVGEFSFNIDSIELGIISFHSLGYRELRIINLQYDAYQINLEKIPLVASRIELISYPHWMPFKYQLWRTRRSEITQRKKDNKKIAEMIFIYNNKEFKFQTFNKKDEIIVDLNVSTKHNML